MATKEEAATDEQALLEQRGKIQSSQGEATVPAALRQALYLLFLWCLLGIALAYGVRLWNDVPGHPSFLPFVGIAFSAILSFVVVMAFRSVSGEVDFQFGQVKFKGASGPVLFWSLCFLVVCYGMYLLGVIEVAKIPASPNYRSCSVGDIAMHRCPPTEMPSEKSVQPQPGSSSSTK